MAQVVYSPRALADLARSLAFLADLYPNAADSAVEAIQSAVGMLAHHPLIGRPVRRDVRELVISFGRTGFVALYRHRTARNRVEVLAIRHQRELDYP